MSSKIRALVLVAALLAISPPAPAKDTTASKAQKSKSRGNGHWLVPPPPAFMPSILPELYYKNGGGKLAHKPKDRLKKYFYTREGYEDPKPVKTNRYVTYWNSNGSVPGVPGSKTLRSY